MEIRKKIAYPILALGLVAFYVWQYQRPDPLWLGKDKDFWYESLYLAFVLGMGIPVLIKWKKSKYFTIRTISCMVTQALVGIPLSICNPSV